MKKLNGKLRRACLQNSLSPSQLSFEEGLTGIKLGWNDPEKAAKEAFEAGTNLAGTMKLINSPKFASWFAGSKAVDEVGKPVRVFHASTADFSEFSKDKIRKIDFDAPFNGFWFSDYPWGAAHQGTQQATVVYPAYLQLKNPAPPSEWRAAGKEALENFDKYKKIGARSEHDAARLILQEKGYDGVIWEDKPKIDLKELKEKGETIFRSARNKLYKLTKEGDSGVTLHVVDGKDSKGNRLWEELTGYDDLKQFMSQQDRTYVVFEPKQIKNALADK